MKLIIDNIFHPGLDTLAKCRTKAAPEITGSYSYITALRFRCRMLGEAKLFMYYYYYYYYTHTTKGENVQQKRIEMKNKVKHMI